MAIQLGTTAKYIHADKTSRKEIINAAGGSVFYKTTSDVSESSKDGTLASGEALTSEKGRYFVSASTSRLNIREVDDRTGQDLVTNAEIEAGIKEVASAATITVTPTGSPVTVIKLTGTTEVTKVNPTFAGHVVVIILKETAKLADGENLKLSAAGPVTADDTLSLVCDGTNWFEVARAVN